MPRCSSNSAAALAPLALAIALAFPGCSSSVPHAEKSAADASAPATPATVTEASVAAPAISAAAEQTQAGAKLLQAGDYEQAIEQFTLAIKSSGAGVDPIVVDNAAASLYRQRGVAYVTTVTRTWREAIDRHLANPAAWSPNPAWQQALSAHAEGHQTTLGPYHRAWH